MSTKKQQPIQQVKRTKRLPEEVRRRRVSDALRRAVRENAELLSRLAK